MRISDIMRLGKSAIIFATIVVAFLAIIWLLGYKMIYKKILHGKKQISIGRIGLVCVLVVYIVVVLYVTLLRGGNCSGCTRIGAGVIWNLGFAESE